MTVVGQAPPDERTRKVSWDMVRRSAKPKTDERLLHVSTKCTSIDDLIKRFGPFASHDGLTVPAREPLQVGDKTRVRLTLADASEVLSARGQVVHVRPPGAGAADTRSVVRVKLLEMDEPSQLLFLRLCEHQSEPAPLAPRADVEKTYVPDGRDDTPPWRPSKPLPPPPPAFSGRAPSKVPAAPAVVRSPALRKPTPIPPARFLTPVPAVRPTPIPASPGLTSNEAANAAPPPRDRSRSNVPTAQPPAPMHMPPEAIAPASLPNEAAMRVAGSQYKLPANPLAELNPEAVRSFVDLGLYEAAGDAPPWQDDDTRRADQPAPGLLDAAWGGEDLLEADGLRGKARHVWQVVRRWVDRLPLPLRRTLMQAIPFAFCTMLGWCVGFNMAGVAPPAPRATAPATTARPALLVAPQAVKETEEAPQAVDPDRQEVQLAAAGPATNPPGAKLDSQAAPAAPAPAAAIVPPAEEGLKKRAQGGACLVRVQTRPADVVVKWGDRVLGKTPLAQATVPCGPAEVTLERDRYDNLTRRVEVIPGVVLQLDAKLKRPAARLTVTSSPPGAAVELNGRPMGKTPRAMAVSRFENVKVDIRLPGHRSWHTSVYLKEAQNTLDAKLDALPPAAVGKKK